MSWFTNRPLPVFPDFKTSFYHPDEQEWVKELEKLTVSRAKKGDRHTFLPVIIGSDYLKSIYPVDTTKEHARDMLLVTEESTALELSTVMTLTQKALATPMGRYISREWIENQREALVRHITPVIILTEPQLWQPEVAA